MERATGVEPATSSLVTIPSRETEGKTETKRVKFLHFPDRREPCSDPIFRQFPAKSPELALKEIEPRVSVTVELAGWQSLRIYTNRIMETAIEFVIQLSADRFLNWFRGNLSHVQYARPLRPVPRSLSIRRHSIMSPYFTSRSSGSPMPRNSV